MSQGKGKNIPSPEQFYRQMFLIRAFEERVLELFSAGKLFGTTHTYIGQEANAVGVLAHLDSDDVVFSNHRCHGHYLAYRDNVDGLMAELMGRADRRVRRQRRQSASPCRKFLHERRSGRYDSVRRRHRVRGKTQRVRRRVVVFLGDGALGEGVVYETFNLASLWSIPLLFVIENNFYAQTTPSHLQIAGEIAARPQAFRIETVHQRPTSVQRCTISPGRRSRTSRNKASRFVWCWTRTALARTAKGTITAIPPKSRNGKRATRCANWRRNWSHRAAKPIEAEIIARIDRAVERASAAEFASAEAINW